MRTRDFLKNTKNHLVYNFYKSNQCIIIMNNIDTFLQKKMNYCEENHLVDFALF